MAQNPFEDAAPAAERPQADRDPGQKRPFLILMSASKVNAALAQKLLKNIQTYVDKAASPLWIDAKGIGVFLTTDLVASEIWRETFQSEKPEDLADTRDFLIVELGSDWTARRDAKTEHWLSTHVGSPRPAPHDRPRQKRK